MRRETKKDRIIGAIIIGLCFFAFFWAIKKRNELITCIMSGKKNCSEWNTQSGEE